MSKANSTPPLSVVPKPPPRQYSPHEDPYDGPELSIIDGEIYLMGDGSMQPAWAHPDRKFVIECFVDMLEIKRLKWERDQRIAARREGIGVVG